MTIEVATPDGSSFQFPDGTPQDVITNALSAHFGEAAAPAADIGENRAGAVSALRGIPVLGGYADKAAAALNAAIQPALGAPGMSSAPTFSERMSENEKLIKSGTDQFETQHPIASTVGQLATGTAALVPLGATAVGARFLGLTGATLPRQVLAGATSGAALGGADAATRGGDVSTGAGIGAATGVAGPVVGRAIGSAVQGAKTLLAPNMTGTPQNVVRVAGVDVPLSGGQVSGDVATQMMEQTARRGGEGQAPQKVAEQFFRGLQEPAVEQARAGVGRNLDQFGQAVADSPQSAAELVSESVRKAAEQSKRGYQGLYDTAATLPGEFHAGAFEGIGQKIRGALTLGKSPVIVDEVTTPIANRALADIDETISRLKIPNAADPFGAPNPQNIVGVNLQGVDQVRKRLNVFRSGTERGTPDRRAVDAIINEFDNQVEGSFARGLFTGDERAFAAVKEARRAFAEHQQTFRSSGAGDDVGRAMERIVGHNGGAGATPTEVANYLYGEARVGGTGLSVRLAQRLQNVLGAQSPEWSGVRQGLWSKLTEATEGRTDWGPQKVSERVYEFLNGSGRPLAHVLFSPQERQLMEQYAGLLKQLVPKPGTVNTSNTAPVLRMLAGNALKGLSVMLGAETAGPVGALGGMAANAGAKALGERNAAGRVARSLYQSPGQNAADQDFLRRSGSVGSLVARLATLPIEQRQ